MELVNRIRCLEKIRKLKVKTAMLPQFFNRNHRKMCDIFANQHDGLEVLDIQKNLEKHGLLEDPEYLKLKSDAEKKVSDFLEKRKESMGKLQEKMKELKEQRVKEGKALLEQTEME